MGAHANITAHKFPQQGELLHCKVGVCFHYNTEQVLFGTIVRDDIESPFECIIALDNGRFVRAVECQYTLL